MFFAGCDIFQPSNPNRHLEQDVSSATKVVEKSADDILGSAYKIDENIINIKQATTTEASPVMEGIRKDADSISTESGKLKGISSDLSKAGVKLEISGRTIDDYVQRATDAEKENEVLEGEVAKLEENAKTGLNRMLKWIVGACIVGAGACAATAVFFGNIKGGLTGAAACLIIMTLAIAVSQYMAWIAAIGGIVLVGTFCVLGYQLFVQRKAISDNVWTQEVVKKNLPLEIKEKIYGSLNEKGTAGRIQSATTQKIISNIKKGFPAAWRETKKD